MDKTKETFYDIYLKWAKNWTSRPKEKRKICYVVERSEEKESNHDQERTTSRTAGVG